MKIPDQAQRVFKGEIFDVYHWDQQMFDGSIAVFEALKRPDTIQILPTNGESLFLSYEEQPNKPPSFTFLGGRQEEGEEPLTVAKRELLEESGMESTDWQLLKTYESDGKIQWSTYFFVARNCQKIAEPHLDAGERIEVKKVSWEEFLEIIDRDDFWGKNIAHDIHMMKHDDKKLAAFKQNVFGK